jgi:hypothetical protein
VAQLTPATPCIVQGEGGGRGAGLAADAAYLHLQHGENTTLSGGRGGGRVPAINIIQLLQIFLVQKQQPTNTSICFRYFNYQKNKHEVCIGKMKVENWR